MPALGAGRGEARRGEWSREGKGQKHDGEPTHHIIAKGIYRTSSAPPRRTRSNSLSAAAVCILRGLKEAGGGQKEEEEDASVLISCVVKCGGSRWKRRKGVK